MAQTGYTPILLYASGTTGHAPSASNMTSSVLGAELALNYFDGKLFYKDASNAIQVLATKGTASVGGSNTQIQYNNSGTLGGSTLTYNNANGAFTIAAPTSGGTALTVNGALTGSILTVKNNGGSTVFNINASGNAEVFSPNSGVALQVTGSANQDALEVYGNSTTGQSYGLLIQAGTNTSDLPFWIKSYAGSNILRINGNGNVTVYSPASGTPLTVNGSASATVASFIGGSGASTALALTDGQTGNRVWRIANGFTGVGTFDINDQTASATRLTISTAGNFTINAPSSGTALSVSATTGAISIPIASFAQATNGTNFTINSPTGAGAYLFSSAAGDSVLRAEANNLAIGSVSGSTSIATATRTIATFASTGNVTINAPSSGTSLVVNATAGNIGAYIASDFSSAFAIDINSTAVTTGRVAMTFTRGGGTVKQWAIGNDTDGGSDNSFDIRDLTRNVIPFSIGTSGNVTINAPATAASPALGITQNASGSGIAISATAGNTAQMTLYGNSGGVGLYLQGGSDGNGYVNANNSLFLTAGGGARVTVGNNGNVTINAPTSGNTLAISGVASGTAITVTNSTSGSGSEYLQSWSNGTDSNLFVRLNQVGAASKFALIETSTATPITFSTNSSTRMTVGAAGNVTISAPSSGNSLVVNTVAGGAAGAFYAPASNTCSLYLYGNNGAGSLLLQGGNDNNGYITASNTLYLASNSLSRMSLGTTGTVTILAPTSGSGLVVNGSASTPPVAVTFSATAMTVNTNLSNVFTTTFTANVTTAPTISNPSDGQTINWFITQDATGGRTMTWPTSFKWPGGTAGVLSTAANAVDLLVATYRSATGFWYASLAKGFA